MGVKKNIMRHLNDKNSQSLNISSSDINTAENKHHKFQYLIGRKSLETALIKASLHTEMQKFGKKWEKEQTSLLFDGLTAEDKEIARKNNIDVIGIDLTIAQTKALFAIQNLLSFTQYKGNLPAENITSEEFKYNGLMPKLKIILTQYLDVYGVSKNKTKRGWSEYNSNELAEAIKALRDLHDNRHLLIYRKKYKNNNGKELINVIKTVRPLITITEGYEALKLKNMVIEPCPILIDQIHNYYLFKPANYMGEIKLLAPHASKYVYTFIDYLFVQAELHRRTYTGWILKINYEELAYKLRMDSWIKSRNWKQIRGSLKKCYETAIKLDYLISQETSKGVTKEVETLVLNKEKFEKIWKIKEAREQLRLPL